MTNRHIIIFLSSFSNKYDSIHVPYPHRNESKCCNERSNTLKVRKLGNNGGPAAPYTTGNLVYLSEELTGIWEEIHLGNLEKRR